MNKPINQSGQQTNQLIKHNNQLVHRQITDKQASIKAILIAYLIQHTTMHQLSRSQTIGHRIESNILEKNKSMEIKIKIHSFFVFCFAAVLLIFHYC